MKKKTFIDLVEDEFENEYNDKKKKDTYKDLRTQLYKKPTRILPNERTSYKETYPNTSVQMDIVDLPTDKFGYNKLLVATDIHNRMTDAIAMKDKKSNTVKNSYLKMQKNDIINVRDGGRIITDSGREYQGEFKKHLNTKGINLVQIEPGRHLGVVDKKIQDISTAIFRLQGKDELINNKTSKKWIDRLPKLLNLLNKHKAHTPKLKNEIWDSSKKIDLLPIGTKVRQMLYVPRDLVGEKRLYGKFRSTDQRWRKDITTITNIIMHPDTPPMYLLEGVEHPVHFKHVQKV